MVNSCSKDLNSSKVCREGFFFSFLKEGTFSFFKIYLFLAALGLHCCARAFSSCGKWELLFVSVHELLMRWLLLLRSTGPRCAGFSSCGTQAE